MRARSGQLLLSVMGFTTSLPESIDDIDLRLDRMNKFGIDHEVLGLSPLMELPRRADRISLVRTFNDELSAAAQKHPANFSPLASLPYSNVDDALEELDRSVSELGMRGVALGSTFVERSLDGTTRFHRLYEKMARMNVPIFIHPSALRDNSDPFPVLVNTTVNLTAETTIATMRLAVSGVIERHPNMRIVAAHAGGTFPYLAGRIDRASTGFLKRGAFSKPPSESLKRVHVDTAGAGRPALMCAIEFLGTERLVLGTDSPYSNRWGDPTEFTKLVNTLEIAEDDKEKILGGNAARLLGIT